MDNTYYVGLFIIIVFVSLSVFVTWSGQRLFYGTGQCLEAGYPEAHVQFYDGTIYCEKQVDGTDIVRKLSEVQGS